MVYFVKKLSCFLIIRGICAINITNVRNLLHYAQLTSSDTLVVSSGVNGIVNCYIIIF